MIQLRITTLKHTFHDSMEEEHILEAGHWCLVCTTSLPAVLRMNPLWQQGAAQSLADLSENAVVCGHTSEPRESTTIPNVCVVSIIMIIHQVTTKAGPEDSVWQSLTSLAANLKISLCSSS